MPGLGIRVRTQTQTPTQPRPNPNPDAHPEQKRANKSRAGYGARAEPLLKSFQRGPGASPLIPADLPAELHDLGAQQITSFVNPASTSSGSSSGDGVAAGDGGEGLLASVSAAVSPSNEDVAAPPNAVSGWA